MLTFDSFYSIFGQGILLVIGILILLGIITLILGEILIHKNRLFFPSLILFALDLLYSPLKKIAKHLGFDENLIDHIGVDVRNAVNKDKFNSIPPEEKIIVLPHCLRSADCEASLKESGIQCTYCNKCAIGVIKEKAEPMGYRVFIVPGSSFIKKIVGQNKFKAVLGVACYDDLYLTMTAFSDFAPQGVLLSRSGCFETRVDVKTVLEKIGYYDYIKENNKNE